MDNFGFYHYLHYEKPKSLAYYETQYVQHRRQYQIDSFKSGFRLIEQMWDDVFNDTKIIFDRFHLGECVYSPMYRNYDGEYVFDLESECIDTLGTYESRVKLILLTSSNFDFIEDDGLSFDVSKRDTEQKLFIEAFNKSNFTNKIIIDVHNGNGGFKTPEQIFAEAFD